MNWHSIAYKGQGDIEDHVKTAKLRSATVSANIRNLFKTKDRNNNNSDLECAAKEAPLLDMTSVSKHQTEHLNWLKTSKLVKVKCTTE